MGKGDKSAYAIISKRIYRIVIAGIVAHTETTYRFSAIAIEDVVNRWAADDNVNGRLARMTLYARPSLWCRSIR
jgi:hypothetical protein